MAMMPCVSMRYTTALAEFAECASRGERVMMRSHRNGQHVRLALHEPREVARRQHALRAGDRRRRRWTIPRRSASTHDRLAHRRAGRKDRQRIGDHHVVHPREQPPAERAAGMKPREVLAPESLVLEQRHGQRVAQGERGRRARGRREIVRARLLAHPRVERHVAVPAERRVRLPGDARSSAPRSP